MLKFSLNKVNINIIDDKTYKKYGKYFTIFMYNKNNFSSSGVMYLSQKRELMTE